MNIEELKLLLKNKTALELKEIIIQAYSKVPEAKDFIDAIIPDDREVLQQNIELLLKRYQKKIYQYLLPDVLEDAAKETEAYELLNRIRKKNISSNFTINCELYFIECCKEFILTYGYFDENYYIMMDEIFESTCEKIKSENLIEEYRYQVEKLIIFSKEYGLCFTDTCKDLNIYKTVL